MQVSRRALWTKPGAPGVSFSTLAAIIAARGMEDAVAQNDSGRMSAPTVTASNEIRINGNENPVGPGPSALEAILSAFDQSGRYPFNSRLDSRTLIETIADRFDASPENVVVGAGSSEILRNAVRIFAGDDRHIVTADPSYGSPITEAEKRSIDYRQIPLDAELRLDLATMAAASRGAGLVYVCNPNNPTATIHPGDVIESFIEDVSRATPDTLILVDEAYHDYVTDAAHRSMIPRAITQKNVLVTRTFSKAYGMAGLRLGFGIGHPETMDALRRYKLSANVNILAIAAAVASLRDPAHIMNERERNAEARHFTQSFFTKAGYEFTDSQTNFLFVNLRQPAHEFRDACAERKIVVGRDFPPMEKTHCRISLGTMDEMRQACRVFADVLGTDAAEKVA